LSDNSGADTSVNTLTIRCAMPERLIELVSARVGDALGRPVAMLPWEAGATDGEVLLMAPHELSESERRAAVGVVRWSWVHLTSAGVDFVDVDGWDPGVLLTRSWQCYAAPLAEYAVHAILSQEWRGRIRWESGGSAEPGAAAGLWRARIGIAGWGAVGQRVAAVSSALGASVRVLSRTDRPATPDGIRHTTRLTDVLDVDHLVLALPLTESTRGMLSRAALFGAREGIHLINVSRPQIVDQNALYALCAAGRMSATLDVTEPEPLPAGHPLRQLASVRVSDHVAWRSRGSDLAFVDDFAATWQALERGAAIPGAVNHGSASSRARERLRTWSKSRG
jgi:phosphoglycerate dehydrogenase-like enzyme